MFLWISLNSCPLNSLLVQSHQAETIIVKRLIRRCNNVTRVRVNGLNLIMVEPKPWDHGRRKHDAVTHSATLPTTLVSLLRSRSELENKHGTRVKTLMTKPEERTKNHFPAPSNTKAIFVLSKAYQFSFCFVFTENSANNEKCFPVIPYFVKVNLIFVNVSRFMQDQFKIYWRFFISLRYLQIKRKQFLYNKYIFIGVIDGKLYKNVDDVWGNLILRNLFNLNEIVYDTLRCITPKRVTSWLGPSPCHYARATQLLSKKCRNGGEPLATQCLIWLARGLSLRPPALETNALPLDQLIFFFSIFRSVEAPAVQALQHEWLYYLQRNWLRSARW